MSEAETSRRQGTGNGAEPSNDYSADDEVETLEARMSTAKASCSRKSRVSGCTALGLITEILLSVPFAQRKETQEGLRFTAQ
jgi:hypothetical protein